MMVLVSLSFSRCVNFVGRGQVLVLVLNLLVLVLKAVVLVWKGLVLITTLAYGPSSANVLSHTPVGPSAWNA